MGNEGVNHELDDVDDDITFAVGIKDKHIFLQFSKEVSWVGMTASDARRIAMYLIGQANLLDEGESVIRASGEVECEWCGDLYRHHPYDMKELDSNGLPFLNVRCDGKRLKL
jgi:hypothetical protein